MDLIELNAHLAANFSGFLSGLQQNPQTRRILGFIVSPDFEELEPAERRQHLRTILEQRFSGAELGRWLGPIVTMTPEEASVNEPVE